MSTYDINNTKSRKLRGTNSAESNVINTNTDMDKYEIYDIYGNLIATMTDINLENTSSLHGILIIKCITNGKVVKSIKRINL